MNKLTIQDQVLASGEESFSIESRIIREFGERLVKHPEVALLELIKNAYDADADRCTVNYNYPVEISVTDDGHGMTLQEFQRGWMRIGTSSKDTSATSLKYGRAVSGEKGIGRFAVRYLGRRLALETTAFDASRGCLTTLRAEFDWPQFDRNEDLGTVRVPYKLYRAGSAATPGTVLRITELRASTESIDFRGVLTSSLGLLSPFKALLRKDAADDQRDLPELPDEPQETGDPGFELIIKGSDSADEDTRVANEILQNFVIRCVVGVNAGRLKLRLYRRGDSKPFIRINDRYANKVGRIYADLRFFPKRKGTFAAMPVDGRLASSWIREHAGIAVFDRNFRVLPYGTEGDDWLSLAEDTARNERKPKSSIAKRHFPMEEAVASSTKLNYMLRLPTPYQLVGAVQVYGVRSGEQHGEVGLFATADRQGFVDNEAFRQLVDVVRGAAEVIAYADRELQQEQAEKDVQEAARTARAEMRSAISEIQAHPELSSAEKQSLIKRLSSAQAASEVHQDIAKNKEAALEVMSLLGVVAGFMTHEFGTAINQLERSHALIKRHSRGNSAMAADAAALAKHIETLKDFVAYSQGYVKGASIVPGGKEIPARPRIRQVLRVFGKYAEDRQIKVSVDIDSDVNIPEVPLSLYSGVVLNLYTNALKAVTAKSGGGERHIAIRAWNDRGAHRLQVSDTGIGIPSALNDRVFDPLFTTTATNKDPLGSGLGLGLTLVRRGAKAFGGAVNLVKPPPGFTTCFEVKFPMENA